MGLLTISIASFTASRTAGGNPVVNVGPDPPQQCAQFNGTGDPSAVNQTSDVAGRTAQSFGQQINVDQFTGPV